jgi:small subunit ribosomal protein S6
MPYYETVFIARQDLTDLQVKDLTAYFCKIITDNGGKVHKTEHWGLRNFAYRINKSRRGHYIMIETDTPAPAVHEMERQMRIHEDVVRHLTIREEKLSTGPSIVMDKSGRDDDDKKPYNRNNDEKDAA